MKKLTILLLTLLLSATQAEAKSLLISQTATRSLQITHFKEDNGDLTARAATTGKQDINGEFCGLIRIMFVGDNMTFESKSIINVEHTTSEYLVWMSPNATTLKITVPGYSPMKVNFNKDYGLTDGIKSKTTYVMIIEDPQNPAPRLQIPRFEEVSSDLIASDETSGKTNLNGEPCGLIRVRCAGSDISFESKNIKEVDKTQSEYMVWMNPRALKLKIRVPGYLPLYVNLKDHGLKSGIKSKATYVMVIEDSQYTTVRSVVSQTESAEECCIKGYEYYNKKDYKNAFELFQKAADQGNANAQNCLGVMYRNGYGVTKDDAKAVEWYQKAANQGDATAQNNLGHMYHDGYGVPKDDAKALEWYQKAADQGNLNAQTSLGYMYHNGYGVPKDDAKAVEWYQQAANQGDARAQSNLGMSYRDGTGVPKDYAKAMEWFQQAANQGYEIAQTCLGVMYENGNGVPKDYAKAVEWYQKAANQGNALGQTNLGVMYRNGLGVTKDYVKAVEWFQKAVNQGYAKAQTHLGYMYEKGYGVTQDYAKAVEWYQKAANQGNADAQNNLGVMYKNGNGVKKDYAKAVEWYQKAANQGEAYAQSNLGVMYENGEGVTKDFAKAVEWYQKAANQGHERAKTNLANLQKKMADEKNALAQTTNTSTKKPAEQPKVQPKPQPRVGLDVVDTDIPVISRVNENTFAIIIANEDYQDETKVDYAKNDGEVFKNYCHKTLGLPQKNVHLVVNATRNNIVGELYWLSKVCKAYKGDASIIFYYAGHGLPDEDSGSAYLLPVDGKSELLPTCYSINELYETLGSLPTKRVTVLMDACFSGAKRNGGMLASARGVAIKAKAAAPKGSMIVLSAAQGNETAYKYEDAKHGLFTYFLLKKLKDSKGSVTMGELSDYIQDQVGRYSIVENGKSQTPSIMASDNLRNSWKGLTF